MYPFSVAFVGYLFGAGQPLFNATTLGPVTTQAWYMLAGTFQAQLLLGAYPHGWVARQAFS